MSTHRILFKKFKRNHSPEEIEVIQQIVNELTDGGSTFSVFENGEKKTSKISESSIKIIAPYNAQVNRLKQVLPNMNI